MTATNNQQTATNAATQLDINSPAGAGVNVNSPSGGAQPVPQPAFNNPAPANGGPSVLNVLMNENSFGPAAKQSASSLIALIVLIILVLVALVGLCAVIVVRRKKEGDAFTVTNTAYSPDAAANSNVFANAASVPAQTFAAQAFASQSFASTRSDTMVSARANTMVAPVASNRSDTMVLPAPAYAGAAGGTMGGQSHAVAGGAFKCAQCGNSYHYQTDLDQHTALRHGL